MSESFKPATPEEEKALQISHTRILRIMAVLLIFAVVGSLILADWRFTAGLMLGGILSFVNYFWLKIALKGIFEKATEGERPRFLSAKYIMRYFALGAFIALVYYTGIVSAAAVILGLSVFAFAVVIEAFILIFFHISKREEI